MTNLKYKEKQMFVSPTINAYANQKSSSCCNKISITILCKEDYTSFNRKSRPQRNCVLELKICSIPSVIDPSTESVSSILAPSNPIVSETVEGIVTGCKCSMYGVEIEIKFTLVWVSNSLDWHEHAKRDEAKSSRPSKTYAAAGQSVGGDSRHLSNAYREQRATI